MSFASNTPITAASNRTEHTQQYKKHFADRPTAFAHSARSASTSTGGCSSLTSHDDVGVGPGGVDSETHTALANLGWKIRSRVNQGYTRSSTQMPSDGFMTESDVLNRVSRSRGWSRTSTAPVGCNFDDLRNASGNKVEVHKRRRRSQVEEQVVYMDEGEQRRIAPLPKLSFCSSISSTSSTSSLEDPFPNTAFDRHASAHSRFHEHTPMTDTTMVKQQFLDAPAYDFSMHFDRTDF